MDSNTWLHTLVYICSSIVTISAAVGILGNKVKKWINDDITNSIGKEFDEKIGKLRGDLNKHIQNSEDSNVIIKKTLLDDTRNTLYQAYNSHMKKLKNKARDAWGKSEMKNAMHSSDSLENVKRESKVVF